MSNLRANGPQIYLVYVQWIYCIVSHDWFSPCYKGDAIEISTNYMQYLSFETIHKSPLIQVRTHFLR